MGIWVNMMSNKTASRGIALLLLLALLFTTGCDRGQGEIPASSVQIKEASVDGEGPGKKEEEASSVVTVSQETLAMPDAGSSLLRSSLINEDIYLYAVNSGASRFYQYNIPENRISRLNIQYDGQIEGFSARSDGSLSILHTSEDGKYYISCLGADGTSRDIPLDPAIADSGIIYSFEAMDDGFLIVNSEEVLAVDNDGQLLKSIGQYQHSAQVVRLSGEKAFIVFGGSMNASASDQISTPTRLLYIGTGFNEISSTELSGGYTIFFSGVNESLFTFLAGTIYRYDYFSGSLQELVNVSATGMDVPEYSLGDGRFFSIDRGQPVILSTNTDTESKILTLACYNSDGLIDRAVQAFNRSNCGYTISIQDYSKYDEYDNLNAGLDRYATDVISGKVPDIYDLRSFSADQYASKGFLEDLTPYFKADAELELSDIFAPVMEQAKFRDGVYSVVPCFSVYCFAGAPAILPEKITIADFKAIAEQYTPTELFGPAYTRSEFIEDILIYMRDELYSTETLACNFVTEDFLYMLQYATGLPAERPQVCESADLLAYCGEQLLTKQSRGAFLVDCMSFNNTIYGGKTNYSGFPTSHGSAPALMPSIQFGMSATSENKEGVWQFFKFILSESIQAEIFSKIYLPSNKAALNKATDKIIADFIDMPKKLSILDVNLQDVVIPGTLNTDLAKDEAYAILNRIAFNAQYDEAVYDIIIDACGAFFHGDQSAAQAAEVIQSRVGIFLSEQYG